MIRAATLLLALAGLWARPAAAQSLPHAGAPEHVGLSSERLERIGHAFGAYAEEGRIAGGVGIVVRDGKIAYLEEWGMRDLAAADAMEPDDIFRIYSMTKPITSVAVMMLFEEGRFLLTDPVGAFLPELADLRVARPGETTPAGDVATEPAGRPVTIQDLLRHTSGLSYGIFSGSAVDSLYLEAELVSRTGGLLGPPTLEALVGELGELPLMFQPGTRWHYSLATDVLGRLVEVVAGQPFDRFLSERIFEPLGMEDTGFWVPGPELGRLARTYGHGSSERSLVLGDTLTFTRPPTMLSGGGGLVSTASDYARFAQMLLGGGELDGVRILGLKTVELMTTDHLGGIEGGGLLEPGWGFGLGVAVKTRPGLDGMSGSVGNYSWVGLHGTGFWVDPEERLVGVFLVQIYPNRDIDFRRRFQSLVYQAIVR